MYAGYLDLTKPLVWTVDDALSRADCASYIRRMGEGSAEIAPIVGRHYLIDVVAGLCLAAAASIGAKRACAWEAASRSRRGLPPVW